MHRRAHPPVGAGPHGQQRVVGGVQRGGRGAPRRRGARGADGPQALRDVVVDPGDKATFNRPGRPEPPGHEQQQGPRDPRAELQRVPQRAQGADAERGVHDELQAGHRPDAAQPGEDRGHSCHDNQDRHGDPAAPVDQRPDQQPEGAAADAGRRYPAHPQQVRPALVDHDAHQPAHCGQQRQRAVPGRDPDRQRHPDRDHGLGHGTPGDGHLLGPHDLGEPVGYGTCHPGDGRPATEQASHMLFHIAPALSERLFPGELTVGQERLPRRC